MNPPTEKIVPKLAGELGSYAIPNYIIKMYDRKLIDDGIDECECCGSRHLQKHGTKQKIFCIVILPDGGGFKNVCVWRQCYRCMECHHVNVSGRDLFYEGCEYGRAIVDQCLALAAHNPANRVEGLLMGCGIQVDRRTVLRYIKQFKLKIVERNPLKLGDENVGVNLVQALFGKKTIEELKSEFQDEKFAAGADEVYPRQKGALAKQASLKVLADALNHDAPAVVAATNSCEKKEESSPPPSSPSEEKKPQAACLPLVAEGSTNNKVVGGKEKNPDKKEAAVGAAPKKAEENIVKFNKFPDSFTLALAYITTLKFYASIVCRKVSFNSMLAEVLFQPLRGVSCAMTDGSPIYNRLADDRDLFHYMMNFFKKDPALENFRKGKPPPASSIVASEYMRELCQFVRAEFLSHLMAKHPDLVVKDENGNLHYVGQITTSAIEGANHRLKYELRVPYKDIDTFFGRAILAALWDSMYTFRNGQPEVSFAHMHSSFTFSSVMAATATAETSQPVYHSSNNFTSPNNLAIATMTAQPIPV